MAQKITIDCVQNGWIVTDEFNPAGELMVARYIAKNATQVLIILADLMAAPSMVVSDAMGAGGEVLATPGGIHLVEDPA